LITGIYVGPVLGLAEILVALIAIVVSKLEQQEELSSAKQ